MRAGLEFFQGRRVRRVSAGLWAFVVAFCAGAALAAGAGATPTTITEFPVDVGHSSTLEDLFVDLDGSVWFTDHWWPEGSYHALIGRMDAAGNVEEFDQGLGSKYSSPRGFVAGPDGNIWFADDGSALGGAAIGKITPTGTITEYSAGLGGARPLTLMLGPDGNLWFTGLGSSPVVGFATTGGAISSFGLPGRPWDAAGGADGNVWFTYGHEGIAPAIGRVERQEDGSTVITLFHAGLDADSLPYELVATQNGYLWFSDLSDTTPAIGRVSSNGEIKEFSAGLSPASGLWDLAVGPEGNVWFTDRAGGAVGRITPSGQITEFGKGVLAPNDDGPHYITAGPDGNMWFTYGGGGPAAAIGKVSPAGEITLLHAGLRPSAAPTEITSGPGGQLWFIADESSSPAIGRIIPGDDSPPPGPGAPGPPPPKPSIGHLVLHGGTVHVSRAGKAFVHLDCQSSTACVGELRLTVFRRGWRAGRMIGSASFSVAAGGSSTARLKLDSAARQLLRGSRHQRVQLSVTPASAFVATPVGVALVWPAPRATK